MWKEAEIRSYFILVGFWAQFSPRAWKNQQLPFTFFPKYFQNLERKNVSQVIEIIFIIRNSKKGELLKSVTHVGFFGRAGSAKCLGSFFRGSEQNVTIRRSPLIWGNFSKVCIEIIKSLEIMEKNKNYYISVHGLQWGPPKLEIFQ